VSTQISPDGMYYWDGTNWVVTLSLDGRWRWNGTTWVPVVGAPQVAYQPAPSRVPTSWMKPLQYAVAAWWALSEIYRLFLPSGTMFQLINQSIQREQVFNPNATPLPADLANTMGSLLTVAGVAIAVLIVIGTLMRSTWIYYIVLVLLGPRAVSLPVDLISAASGSALTPASGLVMPSWALWIGILYGITGAALFVWMLVAIVQRGPWAMVRPPAAISPL
jgi:hypothetical protein